VRQELGATIEREVEMHQKTMHQPDVRERIERTFGR
jgi:polyketide biosynthesis enoyl-CoA hydratase PksI